MTGSLILNQGRKSPVTFNDRSPQGRRSPLLLLQDRMRCPNEQPGLNFESRSPSRTPTDRRSPTFSVHTQDRRSPVGDYRSRSPTVHVQGGGYEMDEAIEDAQKAKSPSSTFSYKRTSITLFTPIQMGEKKSPVLPMSIPPITVSNPFETCKIVEKMALSNMQNENVSGSGDKHEPESEKDKPQKEVPEKKERTSVMKEILAFVRKPSKRITTRTGRFAAAFSRAESGSSSGPLIRQSTFSASPAAASNAAKSAITKQMSEVGFEPKISLKFGLNTKMSLKLRRSAVDDKKKDKKSSGDDASGTESDSKSEKVGKKHAKFDRRKSPSNEPFELANIRFEKVGESYIKHECLIDIELNNKSKIVALSDENAQIITNTSNRVSRGPSREFKSHISEEQEIDPADSIEQFRTEIEQYIKPIKPEPIYVNLMELRNELSKIGEGDENKQPAPLTLPKIEFEPPSRRSSFDPPRSPYLENLRSPGVDTDNDFINLNRLDSGGDSFEMVEGERNRESSFEDRYSSRDTSFDISRYQSTSYEDQTSSFELVDIEGRNEEKKSSVDLRKSSIELVDAETFQRTGCSSGRKSSLETHFDYIPSAENTPSKPGFPSAKKPKPERFHISPFSAFSRARSPLSNQTSSNYSSRDSYDSSSSYHHPELQKSPFADPTKQHFPLTIKGPEEVKTFLCTDKRCASIFEPRSSNTLVQSGTLSSTDGSTIRPISTNITCGRPGCLGGTEFEFDPPSPRRAASASPKHTFTFRIVLKKVDSSPEVICPSLERRGRNIDRYKRRDSRKKRLSNAGKSF